MVSATAVSGLSEEPSSSSGPCRDWTSVVMMLEFRSASSVNVSWARYQRGSVDRSAM